MNPFTTDDDADRMTPSHLQDIIEHETNYHFNNREEDNMTEPVKKKVTKPAAPAAAKPAAAKPAAAKPAAAKPAAAKPAAAKNTSGLRGRQVPEGHIGLDALAKELKTTPVALRRKLRKSDIEKPGDGVWAWKDGSRELANVRKLLSTGGKAE